MQQSGPCRHGISGGARRCARGSAAARPPADAAEQGEAERGEEEDAGEGEVGPHVAGDDLDVEAQALVAADELGDGGADGGVDRRIFEADEALRQRRRQRRTFQKVRSGPAPVERQKRVSSSLSEPKAWMALRAIGKKQTSTTMITFGRRPKPSQEMNSGAKAIFGTISRLTKKG